MEKLIQPILRAFDSFMPGYKTYFMMLMGIMMCICQMMGYHAFAPETWALVGMTGGITWKLGMDRHALNSKK
jgi:hypothetical protein